MASPQQSRIQSYLERNKIGPLFEELMTKLITETPDHPIPFLIDHLQTKQDSPGKLHRAFSGSAALWAQSSPVKTSHRPKKKMPRSVECPSWDWRESRDFDELSHILQESKKLGKALESLSRSIAISDELDQHFLGYNAVLRPRVVGEWVGREDNDLDPLAAEMLHPPVPRAKTEVCWSGENSPVRSLKMETKSKGLKEQQQHHKKLLAAMLSQDSFDLVNSPASSVVEEEIEDEDDAMELLEDLDDLRMEGVTGLAPSGSKFSQGRSSYQPELQAKVTLNICSRFSLLASILLSRINSPALCPFFLFQDEFYQQLQAIRQPWHIPSDTDSDIMEPPEQDKSESPTFFFFSFFLFPDGVFHLIAKQLHMTLLQVKDIVTMLIMPSNTLKC
uniref:Chromosome 8 open reading frame 34 n=1 Tax=Poecilia reticulata TaxID=8081 RepID=A0A3P9PZY2_POERE